MSRTSVSLLPLEDARDAALFFVVGVLCFLAALAALSAKSTYGAARAWTAEVEGEYTVSMAGVDSAVANKAALLIAGLDGVAAARMLPREEIGALLEPSFGTRDFPQSLPLPQIIAVQAERGAAPLGDAIATALAAENVIAAVDAHKDWAGDVQRTLALGRLAALAIVGLLAVSAIAVIAFATHAALLARRDIVDVLHIAGAHDRFIAGLFERRFWVLGLRAGTCGALVALAAAALLVFAARSAPERTGLLPQLSLDFPDLVILVLTPVAAGVAARLAARVTVFRSLKSLP